MNQPQILLPALIILQKEYKRNIATLAPVLRREYFIKPEILTKAAHFEPKKSKWL